MGKRAINVRKHISHAKISRASHVIAKKILKNSSNKHVATALAKKFALRVLKDPKATSSAKKLAIKVYKKVLRNKIAHKSHHSNHHVRRITHVNINNMKKEAFANRVVRRIL